MNLAMAMAVSVNANISQHIFNSIIISNYTKSAMLVKAA